MRKPDNCIALRVNEVIELSYGTDTLMDRIEIHSMLSLPFFFFFFNTKYRVEMLWKEHRSSLRIHHYIPPFLFLYYLQCAFIPFTFFFPKSHHLKNFAILSSFFSILQSTWTTQSIYLFFFKKNPRHQSYSALYPKKTC